MWSYICQYYDLDQEGKYYYKIKQVDFDGYFSYTETIVIELSQQEEERKSLVVYPNPIVGDNYLNLNITTDKIHEVSGEIYDMKGALISRIDDTNSNVGIKTIQIDLTDFPQGAYIIRVKIGEEVFVEKITKME